MNDYIRLKKELIANTKIKLLKKNKPLKKVTDILVPDIKDTNGNIILKERLISSLKLKKPLTFINDIISAELHLDSLIKTGNKTFEIKIKNLGSSPCYNAKCILYKQETTALVKVVDSDKFTIGIDEVKIITLSTTIDIAGIYYAVVHDPIMDSFPFANIDNLVKNQLPDPALANSGWNAYTPIGNNLVSNQYWIFEMIPLFADIIGNANAFINSVKKRDSSQSSELKYTVVIPEFLRSSVKKDKISIRFGASCLNSKSMGIIGTTNAASIKLVTFNGTTLQTLKSENKLKSTIINLSKFRNGFKNVLRLKLNIKTKEINFFLQSNQLSRLNINFSQVNLHFEHRQIKEYPAIQLT